MWMSLILLFRWLSCNIPFDHWTVSKAFSNVPSLKKHFKQIPFRHLSHRWKPFKTTGISPWTSVAHKIMGVDLSLTWRKGQGTPICCLVPAGRSPGKSWSWQLAPSLVAPRCHIQSPAWCTGQHFFKIVAKENSRKSQIKSFKSKIKYDWKT